MKHVKNIKGGKMVRSKDIQRNIQEKNDWESIPYKERINRKLLVHDYDIEKLIVVPMGDEHMGSLWYDEKTHKENIEWCLKTNTPVILMGDTMETATRDSVGAGVFEQSEIVQEQLERAINTYQPLAEEGLIIGNHIGNHEARVYNHSGANLSKIFADMLGIKYLGVGAIHYFRIGKERYTMYTCHGSSGSRLPHTKIKAVLDLSNMIDVDIYAMGHLHALDHHVKNCYRVDKSKRTVVEYNQHFILTGCYLKHWGGYGHVKGYQPSRRGSAKVKMSGLEHRVRVSL
jgi:hypothetical protein